MPIALPPGDNQDAPTQPTASTSNPGTPTPGPAGAQTSQNAPGGEASSANNSFTGELPAGGEEPDGTRFEYGRVGDFVGPDCLDHENMVSFELNGDDRTTTAHGPDALNVLRSTGRDGWTRGEIFKVTFDSDCLPTEIERYEPDVPLTNGYH